jgi:hypothetical protein
MDKQNVNASTGGINSRANATRTLLCCGVAAGPLFLLLFAIQIFIRPEYHFTRSEPSLLSLGTRGWIQIANFMLGGLLVVAGALGMRRVLRSRKGGFWGPALLVVFGICEVGVGIFVVDPVRTPATSTLHGTLHIVFGGIGFLALMIACFVFLRTFFSLKQKVWAVFCALSGLLFLASFFSAARASQGGMNVQLFLNLVFVFAWIWLSSMAARILGSVPKSPINQSIL